LTEFICGIALQFNVALYTAAQKVVDEREAAKPQRHRKERDIEL
jgi:hypothetical protein